MRHSGRAVAVKRCKEALDSAFFEQARMFRYILIGRVLGLDKALMTDGRDEEVLKDISHQLGTFCHPGCRAQCPV